jgi:hypothetical protein
MIFEPRIPKRPPKPFAFIIDANTSLLEICSEQGWTERHTTVADGRAAFERHRGTVLYSLVPPSQLVWFDDARNWKIIRYHNRTIRLIYRDETHIHPWSFAGRDPQALLPFFDALADLKVGPASLTTMASNSWLRTLPHKQPIIEWGKGEKIGPTALIGGRKEAQQPLPRIREGMKYLDLPAAYLQAMESPLPMYLREESPEWHDDGIAEAIVNVPEQSWNPLPVRLGTGKRGTDFQVYGHGEIQGVFTIGELRNAVENHGVDARLLRTWKGYKPKPIFEHWLPWAYELRKLPGMAGVVAKHLTIRLWSKFSYDPSKYKKQEVTFLDARGERQTKPREIPATPGRSETVFLSALITSRVRVRLLQELAAKGCVYLDTDGGIVPHEIHVSGWHEKRIMDRVEIKATQAYRWRCPDCGITHNPAFIPDHLVGLERAQEAWHYSVAGFKPDGPLVPAMFECTEPDQFLTLHRYSSTIPAQSFSEAQAWMKDQTNLKSKRDMRKSIISSPDISS